MMKKFVLTAAAAALAGASLSAEGQLDLQSQARLRQIRLEQKAAGSSNGILRRLAKVTAGSTADSLRRLSAFVTLAPGATRADLESEGASVISLRGDIAVCLLNADDAETLAASPFVKSMSLGRKANPNMDLARKDTGLDMVHAGETADNAETRLPYTGKGVMLGVVDEGIDPGHLNFLNPDGTHRVAYLTHILPKSNNDIDLRAYANEEEIDNIPNAVPIAGFTTDTPYAYHGTHTMGIAGGNYRGTVTMADYSKYTSHEVAVPLIETENPYYGAAPEATLTASCGDLQDAIIATGADQMALFADAHAMPSVISMSLGSNSGPHDTNSTMSRFLDMLITKAPNNPNPPIVVISAGNEGDHKIALKKNLSSYDDVMTTLIWPYYMQYSPDVPNSKTLRQDNVAIYAADATKLDIQAIIYNRERKRVALRMAVNGDDIGQYYITDDYYQITDSDILDAQLKKWFYGFVGVGGMIDSETGRYYAMLDYALQDNEENNLDDNYILGFEVRIRPGETIPEGGLNIEAYCSGASTEMYDYGQPGFDDGSRNGSISDMAVSPKLIVVGSYNTRQDWLCLDGLRSYYTTDDPDYFAPGYVSGFSSFGTLADGRNLPTVCGPGAAIISSVNRYYTDLYKENVEEAEIARTFQAVATGSDGKENYWKQEVGTSMSTPFVAGAIACWLEADPTLDYEEVREIICNTAVVDDQVRAGDPVQWGAGKFSAIEGLKEVLRRSAVRTVSADDKSGALIITPAGRNAYTVFASGKCPLDLTVYNTQGMAVKTVSTTSDEMTVDLGDLAAGVYILSSGSQSARVLVR